MLNQRRAIPDHTTRSPAMTIAVVSPSNLPSRSRAPGDRRWRGHPPGGDQKETPGSGDLLSSPQARRQRQNSRLCRHGIESPLGRRQWRIGPFPLWCRRCPRRVWRPALLLRTPNMDLSGTRSDMRSGWAYANSCPGDASLNAQGIPLRGSLRRAGSGVKCILGFMMLVQDTQFLIESIGNND